MIPFSKTFESPGTVKFLAAVETVTAGGGASTTYPDPSAGVVVSANVQAGDTTKVTRSQADGVDVSRAEFVVCLLDDPSPLNGGKGCRRDDAFWWSKDGRLLVCEGDAVPVGTVWRVKCVARQ